MKNIIEQEDVGKEIGELGLVLCGSKLHPFSLKTDEWKSVYAKNFAYTPEIQKKHIDNLEAMAGLRDDHQTELGTTPAGANCYIQNTDFKKTGKKIKKSMANHSKAVKRNYKKRVEK